MKNITEGNKKLKARMFPTIKIDIIITNKTNHILEIILPNPLS